MKHILPEIEILSNSACSKLAVPYFANTISAGFPSPAENYLKESLDLNEYLIYNKEATFFVRVIGDSMINASIHPSDLLIVDRSLEPKNNSIIIAVVNNEFTVKRLKIDKNQVYLLAENPKYADIKINEEEDFQIWGVVTNVVHKCL